MFARERVKQPSLPAMEMERQHEVDAFVDDVKKNLPEGQLTVRDGLMLRNPASSLVQLSAGGVATSLQVQDTMVRLELLSCISQSTLRSIVALARDPASIVPDFDKINSDVWRMGEMNTSHSLLGILKGQKQVTFTLFPYRREIVLSALKVSQDGVWLKSPEKE